MLSQHRIKGGCHQACYFIANDVKATWLLPNHVAPLTCGVTFNLHKDTNNENTRRTTEKARAEFTAPPASTICRKRSRSGVKNPILQGMVPPFATTITHNPYKYQQKEPLFEVQLAGLFCIFPRQAQEKTVQAIGHTVYSQVTAKDHSIP